MKLWFLRKRRSPQLSVLERLRRLHDQARRDAEELTDGTQIGLTNAGVFLRIAEMIRRELEGSED